MIVRSRRRREGWLGQIQSAWLRRKLKIADFLSEKQWRRCLCKECARSERRDLVFSVLWIDPIKGTGKRLLYESVPQMRKRLRITDEIGTLQGALVVLLPETTPADAGYVANDMQQILHQANVAANIEIYSYPNLPFPSDGPKGSDDFAGHGAELYSFGDRPESNWQSADAVNGEVTNHPMPEAAAQNAEDSDYSNGNESRPETGPSIKSGSCSRRSVERGQSNQEPQVPVKRFQAQRLEFDHPTPAWKRLMDICGAVTGLMVLSPVFLMSALAIRCTSRGPVFFTQIREGKGGSWFKIYKFRTMKMGSETEKHFIRQMSEQDGPAFKLKNDPRVTWVGRYLRISCVDELPQLMNVLKGEMSLVGPRPLPIEESLLCSRWHRRRLDVLPGMTCFWQVDGGRDIPFDQWMRMDRDYLKRRGLLTDLLVLAKTAKVTFMLRGSV